MPDPGGVKTTANSPLKIIVPVTALCLLVGVLAFVLLADRTPKLDLEILQAKRALWSAKGSGDYDISIRIKVDRQDESSAAVSVKRPRAKSAITVRAVFMGGTLGEVGEEIQECDV